jgi:hypothetical protein
MAYVAGSRQGTVRAERPRALVRRVAVLIDARTTPVEHAGALFGALAERGSVTVGRAYADWAAPEVQSWLPVVRTQGIQPRHHVVRGPDGRSAIAVAMALDALDVAHDPAVDAVAVVGDLCSVQPLLPRLRAAGVAVLAFGLEDTPYDVRALCEEHADVTLLDSHPGADSDSGAALGRGRRPA